MNRWKKIRKWARNFVTASLIAGAMLGSFNKGVSAEKVKHGVSKSQIQVLSASLEQSHTISTLITHAGNKQRAAQKLINNISHAHARVHNIDYHNNEGNADWQLRRMSDDIDKADAKLLSALKDLKLAKHLVQNLKNVGSGGDLSELEAYVDIMIEDVEKERDSYNEISSKISGDHFRRLTGGSDGVTSIKAERGDLPPHSPTTTIDSGAWR
jgi:hypothetical protein